MKGPYDWDESDLLGLIANQRKESIDLDYKQSYALQKRGAQADKCRQDLSKDVSAFANSTGGTLVYGMVENGYIPTKLDPGSDPADITKEWIEQVINSGIQPRLDGVLINQVGLLTTSPGRVAYVIQIPQSIRAPHQASDKKYYKRFNFESVAMEDYEIKDMMRRASSPDLHCTFSMLYAANLLKQLMIDPRDTQVALIVGIVNEAPTPAEYAVVNLFFDKRLYVTPTGNVVPITSYEGEFQSQRVQVLQIPWSIPTKMPLLQDIPSQLVSGPINIMTASPPITSNKPPIIRETYLLGWEVHSPGMTTTSGSIEMIFDPTGITLVEVN